MENRIIRNLLKHKILKLFTRTFIVNLFFSYCLILWAFASILEPLSIKYFSYGLYEILYLLWYSLLAVSLFILSKIISLIIKTNRKFSVIILCCLSLFFYIMLCYWQFGNLLSNFALLYQYPRFTMVDAFRTTYPIGIILFIMVILFFRDKFKSKAKYDLILNLDCNQEAIYLEKSRVLYFVSTETLVQIFYIRNNKNVEIKTVELTLNNLQNQLSEENFIRCHKSYIINKNYVEAIMGDTQNMKVKIAMANVLVPVARSKINLVLINFPKLSPQLAI